MKRFLVFAFLISVYTACNDDNDPGVKPSDPEIIAVAVNYVVSDDQISEQAEAHTVVIELSEAAKADGSLEITLSGDIETGFFTTEPAISSGKIVLAVAEGDTEVSFEVLPINNAKLNGNKTISFVLANATGSVTLGESTEYLLTLEDDELANKLQIQERTGAPLTYSKRSYEYNENGSVSKIHWESRTGFGSSTGIDEYSYNEAGGITNISRFDGAQQTKYIWNEGLIVKVESVQNGVLNSYNVYEYYENGRVRNVDFFSKNMAGEFVSTTYVSYSYFEDGNVHKIVQYSFDSEADEFLVTSITTYEGYVEGHNPAPLEMFPGHSIQTKLPSSYSRQLASGLQEYNVEYEFSENGKQTKKTVTGFITDSGVTTYVYY